MPNTIVSATFSVTITDIFTYNTNLLYAGEYFDANAQHYNNRARWYNPYNGRFNRTDPYPGAPQDPQSLHKYLYCHANPVNAIDPSGRSIVGVAMAVGTWIMAHKLLVSVIAGVGILAYLTYHDRSKAINSVEIYLPPGDNIFRKNVINKKSEFENHLGTIVNTSIILGYAPDEKYGYISDTKTYRILVNWMDRGPVGQADNEYIDINYKAYIDSIENYEFIEQEKFNQQEREFLAANALMHETVHSIYDHDTRLLRAMAQHESTGLMVGWRWGDWFHPTFYEANRNSIKEMIPFSSKTQRRLREAITE